MLEAFLHRIRGVATWCGMHQPDTLENGSGEEFPFRAELYNQEQLEKHARQIAESHQLASVFAKDRLLPRLTENEEILLETYDLINAATERNRTIAPASEWLLDNFYLIQEQIRSTRMLLPKSFSSGLPRLSNGPFANYPRVYGIALELIAHTDGRVDTNSLEAFITAYQAVTTLKLGELWALPLTFRLALIENLRRIAVRLAKGRCHRDMANDWAERINQAVEKSQTDLIVALADMARANPPLTGSFLGEFTRHLQGQNPHLAFANTWLEHRLADQGQTVERMVQQDGQDQAADQVSVGNSINSLRFLSIYDWRLFVDKQSLVEKTLSEDPAGVYQMMDFPTRNRYRSAVEALAKRSPFSEYEIAHRTVQLAKTEKGYQGGERTTHVGYFLIDQGRSTLEGYVEMHLTFRVLLDKVRRFIPLPLYLFLMFFFTALILQRLLFLADWKREPVILAWLLALPVFLSAWQLGIAALNWLTTTLVRPQPLARMDYRKGIPRENRTLVVVPTMLTSAHTIEHLLECLEIRYLANRDENLFFSLLTDLPDADRKELPGDGALIRQVREGIELLNQKHPRADGDTFYLFHRDRAWNQADQIWMGYERKRGKLGDLNATLRQGKNRFSLIVGTTSALQEVRFVITLDTDTQLPRNAAREMVGTMAHPLNRPVFDPSGKQVIGGYSILQPRVGASLPAAQQSWFSYIYGGELGVDPYTRVVSDLYQDLFGEGSFIGKGIYDVDAFERFCGHFPENTILSHDLLEGCHCRSAFLSDVILYEDYPTSYAADVKRRHRWIRGDWQILWWLFPRVRCGGNRWEKNRISGPSYWKIFDNLRRSLVPPALLGLLVITWLWALPWTALVATLFVTTVFLAPVLFSTLGNLLTKPKGLPLYTHLSAVTSAGAKPLAQGFLGLFFLPHEAFLNLDAIVRTLFRLTWSRRNLLEWTTSLEADRNSRGGVWDFYRLMWIAPTLGLGILGLGWFNGQGNPPLAGPIAVCWCLAPLIAWCLSRPLTEAVIPLDARQRIFLRNTARKTWRYFETFVNELENWLPPDNVQTNAALKVASRTSPTNIALGLLGDLAAHDFGYCTVGQLITRTQNTFKTLARMERHRGHFYNWYDTRTLSPLKPLYISTVDSGNMASLLLVLAQGFRELTESGVFSVKSLDGLRDTLAILREESLQETPGAPPRALVDGDILRRIDRAIEELDRSSFSLTCLSESLPKWIREAAEIGAPLSEGSELKWWATAWERSCTEQWSEARAFASWKTIPTAPHSFWKLAGNETVSPLAELHARLLMLDKRPTLREVASLTETLVPLLDAIQDHPALDGEARAFLGTGWLDQMRSAVEGSASQAKARIKTLEDLASQCEDFACMEFGFLENKTRELYSIGFNATENKLDAGCYDLLASEARLASYVLIAQGQIGQEHWFSLGRMLTNTGGAPALLSWSGSMFEYLMPLLVMPTYENTLLDRTCRAVVHRQIKYGRQRGVPWGLSESGYNAFDILGNYQYRAFGVPGMGLKRGLAENLVTAPYASALALMVEPVAACKNLQRLAAEGQNAGYGFYEAVDYTPSRLPPGITSVTVRQFMAHHAGMSLLSIAYALLDKPMQRRFCANPLLRAGDLLLQERVPKASIPVYPHAAEAGVTRTVTAEQAGTMRVFTNPNTVVPEVHLLSNGSYHLMVSNAGGGYSRWRDIAVTRWREDTTRDCRGTFCYLRDLESGALWSNAFHPTEVLGQKYEAIFTQSRAEFRRTDEQIETHTQICVSPEEDLELKRVSLTNHSDSTRMIELTTYGEVVLAPQAQDESHPAFNNLFVQTEINPARKAIVCTRRPRSSGENPPWMVHMVSLDDTFAVGTSYETDRMKFTGRGRTLRFPRVFDQRAPLSNTEGPVLDPIVSIRQIIRIPANQTVTVDLVTGVGENRETVAAMAEKFSDSHLADRAFEIAWTRGLIMLRQLNVLEEDAQLFGRLAGSLVFASSLRRAQPGILARNNRGQSGLWGYGISGDLPIVLIRIRNPEKTEVVRKAVQAHAYWRMKGLKVDLVIWNEDYTAYRQALQDAIVDIVSASAEAPLLDRPGGVFVCRAKQMSEEDQCLLQTVARVVLDDNAGSFAQQVNKRATLEQPIFPGLFSRRKTERYPSQEVAQRELVFNNQLGGFTRDGKEYIIELPAFANTPAPWVNVIANPWLGTVISESGSSYTWAENSHEFRLTPWQNDPVSDPSGEAFYLRDEQTGAYWSPAPYPARGPNTYVTRHGFGYTIFEHEEDGIFTEMCVFVAMDAPVKITRIRITNRSGRARNLSVTGYCEWVLGELRGKTLMHVTTAVDTATGSLFARNPFSPEFPDRVAFLDCSETPRTLTGDRLEFLGRNGSPEHPVALRRRRLSNRTGAGMDPCGAMQTTFTLEEWQEKTVVFLLGAGGSENEARGLVHRFRGATQAQSALDGVWDYWKKTLGKLHLETPDPALDFLANGWLIYQTISCRMWARSGFYQSGGAYGFRDQLQDAMALVHAQPELLREQILRAASRQFVEGDVQHWWHPPVGRGVRTHFSDDYLWLPLALCRYVQTTGDTGILEEKVAFLASRALEPHEEAHYDLPNITGEKATVYEHAARAINHGLQFGAHGLPLMGCGDWNDGMNLVGKEGKGESVWLGFFLYEVLNQFSCLAKGRGDEMLAERYTVESGRLRGNLEKEGWDGEWYRRAYFDDGTPLGSSQNQECQIDLLSQSWAVLSGAGMKERTQLAMRKVDQLLVKREAGIIQLLEPPFDKSPLEPGYIKGYVPGVRENGGQYTHGAIWAVMAYAAMGEMDLAWELFGMINPVNHGATPEQISSYRVEPYVVAADVYGVTPHTGRGGWTWYTGSAGWMYRLITESLLGIRLEVDKIRFNPHPPRHWPGFKIHYRFRETHYHIEVVNAGKGGGIRCLKLDGQEQPEKFLPLIDDHGSHEVFLDLE